MPEQKTEITLTEIMDYLSTPERPVTTKEFKEFWEKCSPTDKANIRQQVALSKL